MRVRSVWGNLKKGLAGPELGPVGLGPTPGVVDAVGGDAVLEDVELCGGDGAAASQLRRVVGSAEAAVRVQETPDVADGGVAGDDPVLGGHGGHVEVASGDDQVTALGGAAEQFGQGPDLGLAVDAVAVARVGRVGGVGVGIEDLDDVLGLGAKAQAGVGDALANEPVAAPESGWAAVEGVGDHGGFLYGPARENGEAAAESAREVELGVRETGADLPENCSRVSQRRRQKRQRIVSFSLTGEVVIVGPDLLEADYVRTRLDDGELSANLVETGLAELGEVELEAPAVEGDDVDFGRKGGFHCQVVCVHFELRGCAITMDKSKPYLWLQYVFFVFYL